MKTIRGRCVLMFGNTFSPAVTETVQRLELKVIHIGDSPGETNFEIIGRIKSNNKDYKALIDDIDSIGSNPSIIYTGSEEYILLKSYLCEFYGIPFLKPFLIERVVEKEEMRRVLQKNSPDITPAYRQARTKADVIAFIEEFKLPVMLKPSGLERSFLVNEADSKEEAISAFNLISAKMDSLYKKRANKNRPKIIIEEYMIGPKFSVEGVVDVEGNTIFPETVTDLYFGYDIGINDPFNFSRMVPSALENTELESVLQASKIAVKSLGLTSCPIHAEIILTDSGAKVIEIAARIGGFREVMYNLAFGYSLLQADFEIQVYGTTKLVAMRNSYAAGLKIYAYDEGLLQGLTNENKIQDLSSVKYAVRKIKDGEKVGPSRHGYSEIAYSILGSDDRAQLQKDHDYIVNNVRPIVQ